MTDTLIKGIRQKLQSLPFILLLFFGTLILLMALLNHFFLRSYAFDFTAYNFAFYDYAHFRVSPCPVYLFPYDVTFLQDHFSITLMFLSPFYWLLGGITGSYTLLILQSLIVVAGGWATYRFIQLKSANQWLAVLALVYYFILLGRLTAPVADCNLAVIGSALVPLFLYYFEKNNFFQSAVFFVLMILNREDFSLWLIFICIFLMVIYRKDKLKVTRALFFFIASIVCFVIIFMFLIPALEDENKKYTLFNFMALGNSPAEALTFILKHPLRAIELLFVNHSGNNYFDGIKQEFYIVFLLSGGCLLFYRPLFFIPLIPLIAKKMYNDEPIRWSAESYYSVEIVSILPVLVFLIIAGFKNEKLRLFIASGICTVTLFTTVLKITRPAHEHIALLGDTQKFNFLNKDFYRSEYDLNEIYETMKLIPDTARVSASGRISTHLAFRKKIYYFPRVDDANYLFVIKRNDNWPISQGRADTLVKELVEQKGWQVISDKKDFIFLHKGN